MAVLAADTALATPWAATGDRQLRRDIELLSAYGVVDGPITTWPIPWAQISRGISSAILEQLPAHVQNALARVRSHIPRSRDYRGIGLEIEARGTNSPRIVRGFDGGARQDADIKLSADKHMSSTYIRLSPVKALFLPLNKQGLCQQVANLQKTGKLGRTKDSRWIILKIS